MNELEKYTKVEQNFITSIGVSIYEKNRIFFSQNDNKMQKWGENWKKQEENDVLSNEIKSLTSELLKKREETYKMRDELYKNNINDQEEIKTTYELKISGILDKLEKEREKRRECVNNETKQLTTIYKNKIMEENERYNILSHTLCREREEKHNAMKDMEEKLRVSFDKQLVIERAQKNKLETGIFNEIERRSNEKVIGASKDNAVMKSRIDNLEIALDEKKREIDIIRKKYSLSSKGIEFETAIYENLRLVLEKNYDNIWEIHHVGQQLGKKGDIILQHKITGARIMIDPKNHDSVSKAHKDKFLNDMRNPLNNYDGGLMVSRGKIAGMKSFESKMEGTKLLWYDSFYKVGQADYLLSMIERMHQEIQGVSEGKINMNRLQDKYLCEFKEVKKQKTLSETQAKYFATRETELATEYYDYFGKDIQIDNLDKNNSLIDVSKLLYDFFNVNIIKDECSNVSLKEIRTAVNKIIPNVNSKRVTRCLNSWRKDKHGDSKKLTTRAPIKGYKLLI